MSFKVFDDDELKKNEEILFSVINYNSEKTNSSLEKSILKKIQKQ